MCLLLCGDADAFSYLLCLPFMIALLSITVCKYHQSYQLHFAHASLSRQVLTGSSHLAVTLQVELTFMCLNNSSLNMA